MRKVVGYTKDNNGIFVKDSPKSPASPSPEANPADISIDSLIGIGLLGLDRLMKSILRHITAETYERDTVMNLKDVMTMLHSLKAIEKEQLAELSDDDLEKMSK